MTDCVYLIRASNGLTKIGWTTDVEQRLRHLQSASPLKLDLLHVIETERAKELERLLHDRFKKRRKIGEWFRLTTIEISAICEKYAPRLPDLPPADPPPVRWGANRSVSQVAVLIGRRPLTIHRWLHAGHLSGFKLPSGHWRIAESDLEAWRRSYPRRAPGSEE